MEIRQQRALQRSSAHVLLVFCFMAVAVCSAVRAQDDLTLHTVEGQPLGANVSRLLEALRFLGRPLGEGLEKALNEAIAQRDADRIQQLLDPYVLVEVSLNPEVRVKATRGPGKGVLQQGGFTPVIIKVVNESTVTRQLRIFSPQAGPVYSGAALAILKRQAQTELLDGAVEANRGDRFLELEMYRSPPMTRNLSGLEVEYALALIYCQESGRREATLEFDVGAGTQDIGFRGEVPVLFDVQPAIPVKLSIKDFDGSPTAARLTIRDAQGHVYPPQAKRLAPDFFFQPQIYRADGDVVLLPPGRFLVESCRGPEYLIKQSDFVVSASKENEWTFELDRWVNPKSHGFFCGDHHIHGAGCSHYESPTEGVLPKDMFMQVKGEGLNVGCVLTWGPCFDYQRQFFSPLADQLSEPDCLLKYDLEISGFGSAALGHVCLLNLRDQTYPGSEGTKTQGWPTWTVPVLKWCKDQGGITGYPHSAMHVNPQAGAARIVERWDLNGDGVLTPQEAAGALLPEPMPQVDGDRDGSLGVSELAESLNRVADQLPNLAVPEMNGAGAMEIFVSVPEGVCDFISAMDTARVSEWNTWYHLLNCGYPLKISGETDFPCMSSRRVGQGRVYARLGELEHLDFTQWCDAVAEGRSYVSDGFAHALEFEVNGRQPGPESVQLDQAGKVTVKAQVAFAPRIPKAVAYGQLAPAGGIRWVGDTVNLHAPRNKEWVVGGMRKVEIVAGSEVVAQAEVPADGLPHDLEFEIDVDRSTWIALRHFPQLHTNPVNVIVEDRPIRVSRNSARWCAEAVKLLWRNRNHVIAEGEREAAKAAYDRAIQQYEKRAAESPAGE
jgi:hypothetical protein